MLNRLFNNLFNIISHFAIQVILTKLFKIRLIVWKLFFTSVIKTCRKKGLFIGLISLPDMQKLKCKIESTFTTNK